MCVYHFMVLHVSIRQCLSTINSEFLRNSYMNCELCNVSFPRACHCFFFINIYLNKDDYNFPYIILDSHITTAIGDNSGQRNNDSGKGFKRNIILLQFTTMIILHTTRWSYYDDVKYVSTHTIELTHQLFCFVCIHVGFSPAKGTFDISFKWY